MTPPIELLKKELGVIQFVASTSRSSQKKREAKELIPQYEKAIQMLNSDKNVQECDASKAK